MLKNPYHRKFLLIFFLALDLLVVPAFSWAETKYTFTTQENFEYSLESLRRSAQKVLKDHDALKVENKMLDEELIAAQQQLKSFEGEHKTLKQRLQEIDRLIRNKTKEVNELEGNKRRWGTNVMGGEESEVRLENKIYQKQKEHSILQAEIEKLIQDVPQIQDQKTTPPRFSDATLGDLSAEKHKLKQLLSESRVHQKEEQPKIAQLQASLREMAKKKESLNNKRQSLLQQLHALQQAESDAKGAGQESISGEPEETAPRGSIGEDLQKMEDEIALLKSHEQELQYVLVGIQRQLKEKETTPRDLYRDKKQLQDRLSQLKGENQYLAHEILTFMNQADEWKQRKQKFEKILERAKSKELK